MTWEKIRQTLRVVGSLIGSIVLAYLIFNAIQDIRAIPGPIVFHATFIIPGLLITFLTYLMQMINYQWMVKSLGSNPKTNQIIIGYAYSLLHKYIPGSIWGYFSRSDWYEREAAIPPNRSWGASVLEVVTTVSTSLSIWLGYHLAMQRSNTILTLLVIMLPFAVFLPINLLILLFQKPKRNKWLITDLRPIPFRNWIFITVNSYFQWTFFGLGLWIVFNIFSLEVNLTFNNITGFIYSFARAWVSGFLTFLIPTGIGIREVILKDLLSSVTQITSSKAVLVSTTYRLVTLGAELLWVFFSVLQKRRSLLKK